MGFVQGGEGEVASPAHTSGALVFLVGWFICLGFFWFEGEVVVGLLFFSNIITGAQKLSPRRRKRVCFTK